MKLLFTKICFFHFISIFFCIYVFSCFTTFSILSYTVLIIESRPCDPFLFLQCFVLISAVCKVHFLFLSTLSCVLLKYSTDYMAFLMQSFIEKHPNHTRSKVY